MFCKLQKLPIKNTLDVMHVECNMPDSVLKYLFSEQDTIVCKDMEEAGVKQHLWLHRDPIRGGNFLKRQMPHVFTQDKQHKFFWHLLGKYVRTYRVCLQKTRRAK